MFSSSTVKYFMGNHKQLSQAFDMAVANPKRDGKYLVSLAAMLSEINYGKKRMKVAIVAAVLFSMSAEATAKKDTFFNPDCKASVIWKAVAEKRDIPELHICSIMNVGGNRWIPRYDPNALKDFSGPAPLGPPVPPEIVKKLLQLYYVK